MGKKAVLRMGMKGLKVVMSKMRRKVQGRQLNTYRTFLQSRGNLRRKLLMIYWDGFPRTKKLWGNKIKTSQKRSGVRKKEKLWELRRSTRTRIKRRMKRYKKVTILKKLLHLRLLLFSRKILFNNVFSAWSLTSWFLFFTVIVNYLNFMISLNNL